MSQYSWEEDDFELPYGVKKMGQAQPKCNKTYIMYHGTSEADARKIMKRGFKPSADGMLGRGVYLSRDQKKASRYPLELPESDRVVLQVRVDVGNVIAIHYQGHPRQKTWHDARYGEFFDTAWCPPNCGMTRSGLEVTCVRDPQCIEVVRRITPSRRKMSQYFWEEDDFELPYGVKKMGQAQPKCNQTYIMYHGTSEADARKIMSTGFKRSADGMLGRGVYLSRDLKKASRYPLEFPECDRVVLRVMVDVGNVIAINYQGHPRQKTWRDARYKEFFDTAWCPPNCGMTRSGLEVTCVRDPQCIEVVCCITPSRCKMYNRPQYDQICWEEDDFKLPYGVKKMYHGTSEANARKIMRSGFKPSADGMLGRGVYLSRDLKKASRYPLGFPESDRVVLQVRVDVGNVITINYQGHPRQKTWHDARYGEVFDTAWCPPNCWMTRSGLEVTCVWDPQCIVVDCCIKPSQRQGPQHDLYR